MSIKKPESWSLWEFENERLRKSLPSDIISEARGDEEEERIQEFLLALALIYNDLKGIVLIRDTMKGAYRAPSLGEVSGHVGEVNGVDAQVLKLLLATLHEALVFIRDTKDAYDLPRVQRLLSETTVNTQVTWDMLRKVADGEVLDDEQFVSFGELPSLLVKARNNVGFHYQIRKQLVDGFRRFFFGSMGSTPGDVREWAYYSARTNAFANSRYYYADAALHGYLFNLFGDQKSTQQRIDDAFELLRAVVHAINDLLLKYHKSLPSR